MIPRRDAWHGTGGDREAASPAERLATLAEMAEKLSPCWQQPERWHESKSELIDACRRLAQALETR